MRSINPFYDQPKVIKLLQNAFKRDRSLALGDVLTTAALGKTAVASGWSHRTVPDQFSYDVHAPLPVQRELSSLAKKLTGKTPISMGARRFKHRDFTILHDEDRQDPGIVALFFPSDWDESWGGYVVFMQQGRTLERFTPRANTLLIVERRKNVRYFVKYINHKAGKNKLIILG